MPAFEKSDVFENVLKNLLDISGRKTSKGHAITTIDSVIKKLELKYDFLKNIKINDNRFVEDSEMISVMEDINHIDSDIMGKALNEIITNTHFSLGSNAGHFFIKELRSNLDGDYITVMKDMGVDLGLMQLESEIKDLGKTISKKE